ncbi:hypothetical protein [Staphylococcus saprophyticus]|nr:hypothetical protein [Staphylococcus saprophyticus]
MVDLGELLVLEKWGLILIMDFDNVFVCLIIIEEGLGNWIGVLV